MPVSGRKPKPPGEAITRHAQQFEWIEVEDVPFAGPVPIRLPASRPILVLGEARDVPIHGFTKRWWKTISHMPHCRLWTMSDWEFALATAMVADQFFYGHAQLATELARREKVLGVTFDARRDLRIRYIEPKATSGDGATVIHLARAL
jgi:hypothetical protein